MSSYVLSGKADSDLLRIARDSIKQWGMKRAQEYILGLHDMFQQLTEFPDMGSDASHIRPNALQITSGSHAIFYRKTNGGILIVRILHKRMDYGQHL